MAEGATRLFDEEPRLFEARLPGWLAHDIGKHALIRGQEVLGPYDTENDAISVGYQTFGNVPLLVKKVLPFERPATFNRDIM
jgi:hypothetical protein